MNNTIEISGKTYELKLTFGSLSFLIKRGVSFSDLNEIDPLLLLQSMLLHEKTVTVEELEATPATHFVSVIKTFGEGMGVGLGKQEKPKQN